MIRGVKAQFDCIGASSETDFTDDRKHIASPTLVMHGDDDQIVPFANAGPLSAELLQNATANAEQSNTAILAFLGAGH